MELDRRAEGLVQMMIQETVETRSEIMGTADMIGLVPPVLDEIMDTAS